jgi:protein-S-isoprenylcysteine O-methyltransferase Ste14
MVVAFTCVSLSAKLITALPVVMVAAWMAARWEGPWTPMRLLGLLLILAGLGVLTLARIQFEKEFSQQPGLVTQGVYSRVRHPMYLFSFVAFAGLLLYLNEPQGILLLLLIQFVQLHRARREEQELEALYGDEYSRYKQQTWF